MSKSAVMTEMNIWVVVSIIACLVAEVSHALGPNGLTWFTGLVLASPCLMFICFWLYLRRTSETPNV